jgi:hypothetical protein
MESRSWPPADARLLHNPGFFGCASRLDTMDRRIDRIERRLELADVATPS